MDVSLRRCYLLERGSGRTLQWPNAMTSTAAIVYGARKMRPR